MPCTSSTMVLKMRRYHLIAEARGRACPGLRAGVQAKGKGEMEMYFVERK